LTYVGGTGSWSKPYKDTGYDVRVITLPDYDVLTYEPPKNVYGILAAPPCTEFAVSGARWWKNKKPEILENALNVFDACIKIINYCKPKFWALENPVGRLKKLRYETLGEPKLIFNPCDYGDAYTKKTLLWGNFNIPTKNYIKPTQADYNQIHYPKNENGKPVAWNSDKCKEIRSITPPGFAKAFYEANR
jgi:hypothetical protein